MRSYCLRGKELTYLAIITSILLAFAEPYFSERILLVFMRFYSAIRSGCTNFPELREGRIISHEYTGYPSHGIEIYNRKQLPELLLLSGRHEDKGGMAMKMKCRKWIRYPDSKTTHRFWSSRIQGSLHASIRISRQRIKIG